MSLQKCLCQSVAIFSALVAVALFAVPASAQEYSWIGAGSGGVALGGPNQPEPQKWRSPVWDLDGDLGVGGAIPGSNVGGTAADNVTILSQDTIGVDTTVLVDGTFDPGTGAVADYGSINDLTVGGGVNTGQTRLSLLNGAMLSIDGTTTIGGIDPIDLTTNRQGQLHIGDSAGVSTLNINGDIFTASDNGGNALQNEDADSTINVSGNIDVGGALTNNIDLRLRRGTIAYTGGAGGQTLNIDDLQILVWTVDGTETVTHTIGTNTGGGTVTVNTTSGTNIARITNNDNPANAQDYTAVLNVNTGGTHAASNLVIGRINNRGDSFIFNASADGTYNVAGGTVNIAGDVSLSRMQESGAGDSHDGATHSSTGEMNLTSGTVTVGDDFFLSRMTNTVDDGFTRNSLATLNMSGGSLAINDDLNMGDEEGTAIINLSGGTLSADDVRARGGDGADTIKITGDAATFTLSNAFDFDNGSNNTLELDFQGGSLITSIVVGGEATIAGSDLVLTDAGALATYSTDIVLLDLSAGGVTTGTFANFAELDIVAGAVGTGYSITYNYLGNGSTALILAVPEPSFVALLGIGCLGLIGRRRRRS